MAELLDTDNFLVNRSSTTKKLQAQDVMAELLDDDLMLVNRADITYKITGAEIKDALDNAVPVTIETVAVSEVEPGVNARYTNKDFITAVNCDIKSAEPIVYGLKAKSEGSLVVQAKTSVITGVSSSTVSSGFAPVLYTGNAPGSQSVTGVGFSPDLVWLKGRSEARGHQLYDTVRGAEKVLNSNGTTAETSDPNLLTSFDADGFSVGSDSGSNSGTMVAWCWDAGDTTVTNNDGTVESQVRSNGNFSIVNYTGGSSGTVNFCSMGHGLSSAPSLIIVKTLDIGKGWAVYHKSVGAGSYLSLDESSAAKITDVAWDDKEPDDTVFYAGTSALTGSDLYNYIAYCWAESPTQSFGTYEGNGSASAGPVIDCGFEPAFVLIKSSTLAKDWRIYDIARQIETSSYPSLRANTSDQEYDISDISIKLTSTGFEVIGSDDGINASSETYIYAAFGGSSDATVLELTDPTGLTEFSPGDDIVQNGGGTPVSSAITNVTNGTAPIYSSQGTIVDNATEIAPIVNAYDGTYVAAGQPAFPSGVVYWGSNDGTVTQSGLNVPFTTKVRIYYNTNASSGASVSINGVSKNLPYVSAAVGGALDWTSAEISSPFTSIALSSINNSVGIYVSAIEVDGAAVLIDGAPQTVLTLTDDTNLANFRVGDVVQSEGTGNTAWNETQDWNSYLSGPYSNVYGNGFNGSSSNGWTIAGDGSSTPGDFTCSVPVEFQSKTLTVTMVTDTNHPEDCTFLTNLLSEQRVDAGGTDLGGSPDNPNSSLYQYVLATGTTGIRFKSTNPSRFASGFTSIEVDGKILVVPSAVKVTAIDEAAPSITTDGGSWSGTDGTGDPAWNQSQVWSNTTGSVGVNPAFPVTAAFDGNLNTAFLVAESDGSSDVTFALGDFAAGKEVKVYGKFQPNSGGISWNGSAASVTKNDTYAWFIIGTTNATNNTLFIGAGAPGPNDASFIAAVSIDGNLLVDTGITSGAPESSVTGSSFNATGKVSSVDAAATPPTMTVSSSDGRWLVTEADYQEDLKLNKVAQSPNYVEVDDAELFCIFDADGNISDVSGTDPGYKDMVSTGTTFESFDLKFPALFSNGKTPDQTLPSGATLCVDVQATNISGFDEKLDTCITPEDPDPEPQADMYGLRFDLARNTILSGSLTELGGTSWTLSFWIKRTAMNVFESMMYVDGTQMLFETDNTNTSFYIANYIAAGGAQKCEFTYSFTANKWTNIVMNQDATAVRAWADGVALTASNSTPVDGVANPSKVMLNGENVGIPGSCYKSEAYYVSGQALEPTAFGYDYENQGKWAPLDKAVIKQNIADAGGFGENGFYLPFNPAATGVNYSAGAQVGIVNAPGWSTVFDGTLSDLGTNNNGVSTLTLPSSVSFSTLRIYAQDNPVDTALKVYVNGTPLSGFTTSLGWLDITGQVTSPLSSLGIQGNGGANSTFMSAIEVDGKILIDHNSIGVDDSGNENNFHDQNFAVGNTSQVWSNGVLLQVESTCLQILLVCHQCLTETKVPGGIDRCNCSYYRLKRNRL